MKTYIYILTDPITNEVRYVGKTINTAKRFAHHLSNNTKTHCRSWIKSLLNKNLLPVFSIIDETTENWAELEKYWIAQFKEWGFKLTNHTLGGEGLFGMKVSQETKDKKSIVMMGKTHTQKTKDKISLINSGKTRTEDCKLKTSNTLKEYYSINPHPIKGIIRGTINNKLEEKEVLEIRELLLAKEQTTSEIAKIYDVSKAVIQQIREGRTWKHLGEFKVVGKLNKLKTKDLEILFDLFNNKTKIKDIQKVLPYCATTIVKQRKLWKKQQES